MNNKKTIITLILILLIGIIGLTVAYFSNSTTLDNLFSTKEYGSTITETFTSPNNWLPGDVTEKKVVVTNTGEVDQAVRISYTEKWLSTNNNELNGWIHEDGSKSNHETELELNTDERVSIINFDNNDDWTYNNGYYYYNYRLQPNQSTSSLIKSVSFNSKTKLDDTCTTTISEGKKTIACNSSGDNYDGATYTLTFKIEIVQFDKYMNAWGTDVAIVETKPVAPTCSYEMGDEISFDGEEYYVLNDSGDYVVALKKELLTEEEVNTYSTDYESLYGEYPYYESSTCYMNKYPYPPYDSGDLSECKNNYNESSVKLIIDSWADNYNNDLVSVDGYKARLINENEIFNYLSYEMYDNGGTDKGFRKTDDTPEWVDNYRYWTMYVTDDSEDRVYQIEYGDLVESNVYTRLTTYNGGMSGFEVFIRPVINLKKSSIEKENNNNSDLPSNSNYAIGNTISYKNNDYCVIKDSDDDEDYITLIKQEPLSYDELVTYNNGYEIERASDNNDIGTMSYYKSDDCYYNSDTDKNTTGCSSNYDTSNIKNVVDNWGNSFNNDLVEVDGYKARLNTYAELIDLGYILRYHGTEIGHFETDSDTKCVGYSYWFNYGAVFGSLTQTKTYEFHPVRPVINLKKCALTNTCE